MKSKIPEVPYPPAEHVLFQALFEVSGSIPLYRNRAK